METRITAGIIVSLPAAGGTGTILWDIDYDARED